jgi:hypothetical protein
MLHSQVKPTVTSPLLLLPGIVLRQRELSVNSDVDYSTTISSTMMMDTDPRDVVISCVHHI